MVSVPFHSQMTKMTQKEILAWVLSLFWGVAFAIFTVWIYIPHCLRQIRNNNRAALFYKISLGASVVFFIYQFLTVVFIIWVIWSQQ